MATADLKVPVGVEIHVDGQALVVGPGDRLVIALRVAVPRPVADALMPQPCPHDCQRFGGKVPGHVRGSNWDWVPCWCDGSGSLPPVLRLLVVEGYWPPGFVTDDDHPPTPHPEHVRAIEAGERIGIEAECETCGGSGWWWCDVDDDEHIRQRCSCTDGRVPVGSVRPVRVMPVVGYMRGRVPDAPCIEVVTASYVREWYECPPDATHDRIMHRMVDLSAYGPAESLVGRFAVEVEEAQRA